MTPEGAIALRASVSAAVRVGALHFEKRGVLRGDAARGSAGGRTAIHDRDVALERRRGGRRRRVVDEDDDLVDGRRDPGRPPEIGDLAQFSRLEIGESLIGADPLPRRDVVERKNDGYVLPTAVDIRVVHADVGAQLSGDSGAAL